MIPQFLNGLGMILVAKNSKNMNDEIGRIMTFYELTQSTNNLYSIV